LGWSGFIIFDHLAEFETAAARLAELALPGKIVTTSRSCRVSPRRDLPNSIAAKTRAS
jgi:hypothetical protein